MKINDAVFGELEYDYVWSRDTTIEFAGKEAEVALTVRGGEDGVFLENQYASYNLLVENWENIQQIILLPILEYYKEKRYELGIDENYPLIETTDQLIKNITLVGISVPSAKRLEDRYIGLSFDCTWDLENGLGVLVE